MAEKDNIAFNIDQAESCRYDLHAYMISHKVLEIRVQDQDQKYTYLLFEGVEYFSGPTNWTGYVFHKSSEYEMKELLESIQSLEYIPNEIKDIWFEGYIALPIDRHNKLPQVIILCRTASQFERSVFLERYWK